MTTPREAVVSMLEDHFLEAEVRVVGYARNVDALDVSTVMVRVDEVAPHPQAPTSHRLYTFALILLAAQTDDTGPGDDELDALLEDVLFALEDDHHLDWTTAKRAQWLETAHPCYEVAVSVTHQKHLPAPPAP